tara:strand:+ start:1034 stop:1708 length:675 start_codon:yes stop_codon:yes gene_type:complete
LTVLPYIFNFIFQLLILLGLIILIRRFLTFSLKSKPSYKKYIFFYDVLVYLIWILFIFIKVADVVNENIIIAGSVVLILVALLWEYLKNLFLGIIFAFQYGYILGNNLLVNGKEGKLVSYSSSYFEILTIKGERLKIKYKEVFKGSFELFKGNLKRVYSRIPINEKSNTKEIQLKIMNHPLFILNNNFDFFQESDHDGQRWFCFYFHVMDYKDAVTINEYIDNL